MLRYPSTAFAAKTSLLIRSSKPYVHSQAKRDTAAAGPVIARGGPRGLQQRYLHRADHGLEPWAGPRACPAVCGPGLERHCDRPAPGRPAGDAGLKDLEAIRASHPNLVIEQLDVTDSVMIKALAAKYRNQPIDVLLNNAAAVEPTFAADMTEIMKPYDKIDFDAARHDFDVNTLGPMRVVQAFAPNVIASKGKRMATITSMAGSFGAPMAGAMGMNYGARNA